MRVLRERCVLVLAIALVAVSCRTTTLPELTISDLDRPLVVEGDVVVERPAGQNVTFSKSSDGMKDPDAVFLTITLDDPYHLPPGLPNCLMNHNVGGPVKDELFVSVHRDKQVVKKILWHLKRDSPENVIGFTRTFTYREVGYTEPFIVDIQGRNTTKHSWPAPPGDTHFFVTTCDYSPGGTCIMRRQCGPKNCATDCRLRAFVADPREPK